VIGYRHSLTGRGRDQNVNAAHVLLFLPKLNLRKKLCLCFIGGYIPTDIAAFIFAFFVVSLHVQSARDQLIGGHTLETLQFEAVAPNAGTAEQTYIGHHDRILRDRSSTQRAFAAFYPFVQLGFFKFPQLPDFMSGDIGFLDPIPDAVFRHAEMRGGFRDADPVFVIIIRHSDTSFSLHKKQFHYNKSDANCKDFVGFCGILNRLAFVDLCGSARRPFLFLSPKQTPKKL
jgi:hypothetical protein